MHIFTVKTPLRNFLIKNIGNYHYYIKNSYILKHIPNLLSKLGITNKAQNQ